MVRAVCSCRAPTYLTRAGLYRTLEGKKKILQDKVDPTRPRVEHLMLTAQDKQEMLKLTRKVRFAIEIAMVNVFWSCL